MSLIDAYEAAAPQPRECGMTNARRVLGEEGWAELLELAARPDVEAARLARALQAQGVRITAHTVERHLAGRCASCVARGHFSEPR